LHNITVNVTINLDGENLSINVSPDLTNITIILDDIFAELNCTNITANSTNEPESALCKKAIRIEDNLIVINNTADYINNLVLHFNNTVFGNLTLQDILDRISNMSVDFGDVLIEIEKLRKFDDELVFLVTDSFGLQQAAKTDVANGDLEAASKKLTDANVKLNQAAARLREHETELKNSTTESVLVVGWWLPITLITLIVILGAYLFTRPGDRQQYYR